MIIDVIKLTWLHPRQAAKLMLNKATKWQLFLLITLTMIVTTIVGNAGTGDGAEDIGSSVGFLIAGVIFSPILGYISIWFSAFIMWLFGMLFQGDGKILELFRAISICSIPMLLSFPFAFAWLIIEPNTYFSDIAEIHMTQISIIASIFIAASYIWSVVVMVGAVAEAHRFSISKAILTVFLPVILLLILFFVYLFVIFS